jgi:hypothetical protein
MDVLFSPQLLSETLLILRRNERGMMINTYWSSCKVAVICVRLQWNLNCCDIYVYENNQQYALYRLIYYSKLAVHISGDVFAYHQERLTVFTVSGSVHSSRCRLVSQVSWNWTKFSLHETVISEVSIIVKKSCFFTVWTVRTDVRLIALNGLCRPALHCSRFLYSYHIHDLRNMSVLRHVHKIAKRDS